MSINDAARSMHETATLLRKGKITADEMRENNRALKANFSDAEWMMVKASAVASMNR